MSNKQVSDKTVYPCQLLIEGIPMRKTDFCWISYEPENKVAAQLYRSAGFIEKGEKCGDEIVAALKL